MQPIAPQPTRTDSNVDFIPRTVQASTTASIVMVLTSELLYIEQGKVFESEGEI